MRVRARAPRRERTLRERLLARYPALAPLTLRAVASLPVRWGPRRSVLVQSARSGWEAVSRGDFELLRLFYAPDAAYATEMPPQLRLPDSPLGGSFRGWEAIQEYMTNFLGAWSEVHFALSDVLLFRSGDRMVAFGHLHVRGLTSGVEVDIPIATLVDIENGVIARQQDYWDFADALRAADLDPTDYPDLGSEAPDR